MDGRQKLTAVLGEGETAPARAEFPILHAYHAIKKIIRH